MTYEDKARFAALMAGVAEVYTKKMTTQLLGIYWRALEHFDYYDIETACNVHVAKNTSQQGGFMPKPSDITRYIEGDNEIRALQALSKVESAMRHLGSYSSVAFDDPIIHAVLDDMGGWVRYCGCKENEIPFQANQFIKRYQGYLYRKLDRYPRYLIGIVERSYELHGFQYKQLPALVGDKAKAEAVIKKGTGSVVEIHYEQKLLAPSDKKLITNIQPAGDADEQK